MLARSFKKWQMREWHLHPASPILPSMFSSYEILIDDDARAAYDSYGLEGLKGMGAGGGMGGGMAMDPEEFLAHLFGGGGGGFPFSFGEGGPSRRTQGDDEVMPVEVTLEDLYNGKTVKMTLEREVVCSTCKGYVAKFADIPMTFVSYNIDLELRHQPSLTNAQDVMVKALHLELLTCVSAFLFFLDLS